MALRKNVHERVILRISLQIARVMEPRWEVKLLTPNHSGDRFGGITQRKFTSRITY